MHGADGVRWAYDMDLILAKYPGQVIGVKWHDGDGMQIADYSTIASAFQINSFPGGSVDRQVVNQSGQNVIAFDRSGRDQVVSQVITNPDLVDVSLNYSINAATRLLTCNISANFNQAGNRRMQV